MKLQILTSFAKQILKTCLKIKKNVEKKSRTTLKLNNKDTNYYFGATDGSFTYSLHTD